MASPKSAQKRGAYVEPERAWNRAEITVYNRAGEVVNTLDHTYPDGVSLTSKYAEIAQMLVGAYTPTVRVLITRFWTPTHPESVICVELDETLSWR